MVDSRFFKNAGPFSLSELVAEIQKAGIDACLGDDSIADNAVQNVAALGSAQAEDLSFLDNPKYISSFQNTNAGVVIVAAQFVKKAPKNTNLIITPEPYFAYALVASKFYPVAQEDEISQRAHIRKSATIGNNCTIEPSAYIGAGVVLGDNCYIHANVSITNAILGDGVIIHQGASIGQDGFGYATFGGKHIKIPQLGRVVISDNVEIGSNTCIDRGSEPDTIIGEGTKIDNLVQIAHNVQIGKSCIIAGQVGIAGSAKIGNYVVIGAQAGVGGHIEIGDGVQIAAQSGTTKAIEAGAKVSGKPAVPLIQYNRQVLTLQNLVKKRK